MAALKELLRQPDTSQADLPTIVKALEEKVREDAIRMAFWALVGDGVLCLNKRFEATLRAA